MAPVLRALASALLVGPSSAYRDDSRGRRPTQDGGYGPQAVSTFWLPGMSTNGNQFTGVFAGAAYALFLVAYKPRPGRTRARRRPRGHPSSITSASAPNLAMAGSVSTNGTATMSPAPIKADDAALPGGPVRGDTENGDMGGEEQAGRRRPKMRSYKQQTENGTREPRRLRRAASAYSSLQERDEKMEEESTRRAEDAEEAAQRAAEAAAAAHMDSDDGTPEDDDLALASDLRSTGPRHITVITTASVPWMTGTAVNPLLRVIYLARDGHDVTLVIPWLIYPNDQRSLFPKNTMFPSREEQTQAVFAWAHREIPGIRFNVMYYDAVYNKDFGSVLPVHTLTALFESPDVPKDVCVMEEPEHLLWHHAGALWTKIFRLVVGVIHTNYIEYAKGFGQFGPQKAMGLAFLNTWVTRGYCHRVIKLSDALQDFPHSVTCNVHGVRDKFIAIGRARSGPFPRGAYFLGKVLWAKGYRDLIDLMEDHYERSNGREPLPIDFFGTGPDVHAVERSVRESAALSLVTFHARVADPMSEYLQGYKVFVNASQSDVVCTATAEALAMGKIAVVLDHPSNEFFSAFPNCLTYRTPEEFSAVLAYALTHEPQPLSDEELFRFSWAAATERFYDAVRIPPSKKRAGRVDTALAQAHTAISKIYRPWEIMNRERSLQLLAEADRNDPESIEAGATDLERAQAAPAAPG